jgi:hypothetical protein
MVGFCSPGLPMSRLRTRQPTQGKLLYGILPLTYAGISFSFNFQHEQHLHSSDAWAPPPSWPRAVPTEVCLAIF